MAADLPLRLAGEEVLLCGERALYWPRRRWLLLADLHLGKGDAFRRAGIALPRGGTGHDLARLEALLRRLPVAQLWILGDMLHAGVAADAAWLAQWRRFRQAHADVALHLVRGNHDRAAGTAALDIDLHPGAVVQPPFVFAHEPRPDPRGHVIAGHVHPVVRLPGMRRRWPAFHLRQALTVLPAFSHFTGGQLLQALPDGRVVVCVEGQAIALPPH